MNKAQSARIATETHKYHNWKGFQPYGVGEQAPYLPSELRGIRRNNLNGCHESEHHRDRLMKRLPN